MNALSVHDIEAIASAANIYPHDELMRRKLTAFALMAYEKGRVDQSESEKEACGFCGAHVESPCETLPPDFCEKGINASFLKPITPSAIDGNLLPPIGSLVKIHSISRDQWVTHKVTGYLVWEGPSTDRHIHRVFIKVIDRNGYTNARLLADLRAPDKDDDINNFPLLPGEIQLKNQHEREFAMEAQ